MDDDEAAQFKAFMDQQRALEEANIVPEEEFVGPTLPHSANAHATRCAPDALAASFGWSYEDRARRWTTPPYCLCQEAQFQVQYTQPYTERRQCRVFCFETTQRNQTGSERQALRRIDALTRDAAAASEGRCCPARACC
jgi:hypothetical protein